MSGRRRGRPTDRTPDVEDQIVKGIMAGQTLKDAALSAGVAEATVHQWRNTVPEFADLITKAKADAKRLRLQRITAAGIRQHDDGQVSGSWQADAWWLERKYPEEFGQRLVIRVSENDSALLRSLGFNSPAEAFRQFIEEARALTEQNDDTNAILGDGFA